MDEAQAFSIATYRRTSTPIQRRRILPSPRNPEDRNYEKWCRILRRAPDVLHVEGFGGCRYVIPGIVAGHLVINKETFEGPEIEKSRKEEAPENPCAEDKNSGQPKKAQKFGKFAEMGGVKWMKKNLNCCGRSKNAKSPGPSGIS